MAGLPFVNDHARFLFFHHPRTLRDAGAGTIHLRRGVDVGLPGPQGLLDSDQLRGWRDFARSIRQELGLSPNEPQGAC